MVENSHTAARPSWLCRRCGCPWPCRLAKGHLLVEYRDEPTGLGLYLAIQWGEASRELDGVDLSDALWPRFVGWIHPLRRR